VANGLTPGQAAVRFWNLSGRDLALTVGGAAHALADGHDLRLELEHDFVWRVESREAQVEHVPSNLSSMEIVIRR
jgi:hypothetical protein